MSSKKQVADYTVMTEVPTNSTHPKTRSEWRAWLEQHHTRDKGVWLISYKKATGKPRFDYEEAVEEALCFGWIDSKGNKLDEERSLLWFAPRKPGTGWSKLNKERVERLIAQNMMMPAGLAKVEAAKQDGSWNALDAIEALEIPPDLETALASYAEAKQNFEAFPRSVKRGILEWVAAAKRPETRTKRINETAQLAAQNLRANQWQR
ncbi:YdeI/OmpD-associated family protein [Leptolyngbya sp. FACHB-541]|uniref:YdeI/OmpD-associated family protein n=1 Tax=Leptolyngbya sp. FACHB-541 TaxID=2692810 RepID=UPI001F54F237|nr:YdeI/OmpD-associated family protein [Leptolyngbya sp. FACHB-541]